MKSAAPTNFTADRQHGAQARLTPGSDRRVTPRFRVDFRTVMSANSPMIEQMGSVLDLSLAGGRVEAALTVHKSLMMELRIYVPDLDWPIMVDEAVVQWVKGNTFGLQFVRLRQTQADRLAWVMTRVAEEGKH
jgi:hypothetical protein